MPRWGTVQWVRDRGKIICSQDGRINYVSGDLSDITDQKAVDEALKMAHFSPPPCLIPSAPW